MVWCALGWSFDLRSGDRSIERHVSQVLAPLACQEAVPCSQYRLDRSTAGPATLDLWLDGEFVGSCRDPATAAGLVLWSVNQQVSSRSEDLVLVHAAGAALHDRAVVLPGESGSGKSTLVTALVAAGLDYLTDEAVAFRTGDGSIAPYHRPISLKQGSWRLFPHLEPVRSGGEASPGPDQWHIDPRSVRAQSLCSSAVPAIVIVPSLSPGRRARAEPISAGEALHALAAGAFNLGTTGQRGLEVLADVVTKSRSYRLPFDDPSEAATTIRTLLATLPPDR